MPRYGILLDLKSKWADERLKTHSPVAGGELKLQRRPPAESANSLQTTLTPNPDKFYNVALE